VRQVVGCWYEHSGFGQLGAATTSMANNLSPYEPFLGEYKKPPSLMKGPDLGVNDKTGSGEEFLRMHTSFMRPRLLNKRWG
jgi:hypothetical protein